MLRRQMAAQSTHAKPAGQLSVDQRQTLNLSPAPSTEEPNEATSAPALPISGQPGQGSAATSARKFRVTGQVSFGRPTLLPQQRSDSLPMQCSAGSVHMQVRNAAILLQSP